MVLRYNGNSGKRVQYKNVTPSFATARPASEMDP